MSVSWLGIEIKLGTQAITSSCDSFPVMQNCSLRDTHRLGICNIVTSLPLGFLINNSWDFLAPFCLKCSANRFPCSTQGSFQFSRKTAASVVKSDSCFYGYRAMYYNMTLFLFPFTLVYLLAMELNNERGEIKKYSWEWKCDPAGKLRPFSIDIE